VTLLLAFDALERQLDHPWHIDAKDKDVRGEGARQLAFLRDARIQCPAVDIFAVPNAGKRSQWEVNQRKREGMKAGALDLVATWKPLIGARGVAFLEFKNGFEDPDPNQRDRLNLYWEQGHHCGVFRRPDTALAFLRACGAPFSDRGWA